MFHLQIIIHDMPLVFQADHVLFAVVKCCTGENGKTVEVAVSFIGGLLVHQVLYGTKRIEHEMRI